MARYRLRAPRTKPLPTKPVLRNAAKDSVCGPRQRDPVDTHIAPLQSSAQALLSRSASLDRPATEKLLLSLQGRYGNEYVGQVLNRARATEETPETQPSLASRKKEEEKDHVATRSQTANPLDKKNIQTSQALDRAPAGKKTSSVQQSENGFIRLIPQAQRFDGKGVPVGPVVNITDASQNVDLGEVTNGDRGFIQFFFHADWDFHGAGLVEEKGNAFLVTTTPFRVPSKTGADDDKVKFGKSRPSLASSQGTGAALDKQPTTSEDPDDLGGSVTISPSITYQLQTAVQGQGGIGVSVLFVSLSENVAVQTAVNEVDSISRAYTANLRYKESKPAPPPVTKQVKRFAMTAEFGVNQRDPKQGELALMEMWWDGQAGLTPLPNNEARAAVQSGQAEVFVVGHASRTGSRAYNLVLAKDRADHVANFLRQDKIMGKGASISTSSAGFDSATGTGESETDRFVEVVFQAQVTDTPAAPPATAPPSAGNVN